MEDNAKKYINTKLKTFVEKLDESLEQQIVNPVSELINKVKELEKRVASIETTGNQGSGATGENEGPVDMMIDAVNLIPVHIVSTMNFMSTVQNMIKGKKECTAKEIADKVLEDHGKIDGKLYVNAMKEFLKDSREKKMKAIWDEVTKLFEGGDGW